MRRQQQPPYPPQELISSLSSRLVGPNMNRNRAQHAQQQEVQRPQIAWSGPSTDRQILALNQTAYAANQLSPYPTMNGYFASHEPQHAMNIPTARQNADPQTASTYQPGAFSQQTVDVVHNGDGHDDDTTPTLSTFPLPNRVATHSSTTAGTVSDERSATPPQPPNTRTSPTPSEESPERDPISPRELRNLLQHAPPRDSQDPPPEWQPTNAQHGSSHSSQSRHHQRDENSRSRWDQFHSQGRASWQQRPYQPHHLGDDAFGNHVQDDAVSSLSSDCETIRPSTASRPADYDADVEDEDAYDEDGDDEPESDVSEVASFPIPPTTDHRQRGLASGRVSPYPQLSRAEQQEVDDLWARPPTPHSVHSQHEDSDEHPHSELTALPASSPTHPTLSQSPVSHQPLASRLLPLVFPSGRNRQKDVAQRRGDTFKQSSQKLEKAREQERAKRHRAASNASFRSRTSTGDTTSSALKTQPSKSALRSSREGSKDTDTHGLTSPKGVRFSSSQDEDSSVRSPSGFGSPRSVSSVTWDNPLASPPMSPSKKYLYPRPAPSTPDSRPSSRNGDASELKSRQRGIRPANLDLRGVNAEASTSPCTPVLSPTRTSRSASQSQESLLASFGRRQRTNSSNSSGPLSPRGFASPSLPSGINSRRLENEEKGEPLNVVHHQWGDSVISLNNRDNRRSLRSASAVDVFTRVDMPPAENKAEAEYTENFLFTASDEERARKKRAAERKGHLKKFLGFATEEGDGKDKGKGKEVQGNDAAEQEHITRVRSESSASSIEKLGNLRSKKSSRDLAELASMPLKVTTGLRRPSTSAQVSSPSSPAAASFDHRPMQMFPALHGSGTMSLDISRGSNVTTGLRSRGRTPNLSRATSAMSIAPGLAISTDARAHAASFDSSPELNAHSDASADDERDSEHEPLSRHQSNSEDARAVSADYHNTMYGYAGPRIASAEMLNDHAVAAGQFTSDAGEGLVAALSNEGIGEDAAGKSDKRERKSGSGSLGKAMGKFFKSKAGKN